MCAAVHSWVGLPLWKTLRFLFVSLLAFLTSEVFVSAGLGSLGCFTLSLEGITFFLFVCLFGPKFWNLLPENIVLNNWKDFSM